MSPVAERGSDQQLGPSLYRRRAGPTKGPSPTGAVISRFREAYGRELWTGSRQLGRQVGAKQSKPALRGRQITADVLGCPQDRGPPAGLEVEGRVAPSGAEVTASSG